MKGCHEKSCCIAMVREWALEVFGNRLRAELWLQTGDEKFKGVPPLYVLNSPNGVVKVMLELGRLKRIKKDAEKAGLTPHTLLDYETVYFHEPFCAVATESMQNHKRFHAVH